MIKKLLSFATILSITLSIKADEGMWLPQLLNTLNQEDMSAKGLKISSDELYNVNASSIKDAIVSLGGFCTGEVISELTSPFANAFSAYGLFKAITD